MIDKDHKIFISLYVLSVFFVLPINVFDESIRILLHRAFFFLCLPFFVFLIKQRPVHLAAIGCSLFSLLMLLLLSVIIGAPIYLNFVFILFVMVLYIPREVVVHISKLFLSVYCIVVLVGVCLYLFKFLIGLDYSYKVYPDNPLKSLYGVVFKSYYGMLLITSSERTYVDLFRFQSIFDEPGVVGTISGILLISLSFMRAPIQKSILVISGVLSLSAAFVVYFVIHLLISSIKSTKQVFFVVFSVFFGGAFFWLLLPDGILQAFADIIAMKVSSGDNRVSECFWNEFYKDIPNHLWFGMGYKATEMLQCDISSFYSQIYDYGLLGFFIILSSFVSVYFVVSVLNSINEGFNVDTRKVLFSMLWVFIISMNFYQRPDYFMPIYLVFLVLFICHVRDNFVVSRGVIGG